MRKNQHYLRGEGGFKHCQIRIPFDVHAKVKKEAALQDVSISYCIVAMIHDWFDDYEGKETDTHKLDKIIKMLDGYDFSE